MQSQLQECSKFSSWKQQFDLFVDESNLWSCGRDNEEEETMTSSPSTVGEKLYGDERGPGIAVLSSGNGRNGKVKIMESEDWT